MAHTGRISRHTSERILPIYTRFAKSFSPYLAFYSIRTCTAGRGRLESTESVNVVRYRGGSAATNDLPISAWSYISTDFRDLRASIDCLCRIPSNKYRDECSAIRRRVKARTTGLFHACMAAVCLWKTSCVKCRRIWRLVSRDRRAKSSEFGGRKRSRDVLSQRFASRSMNESVVVMLRKGPDDLR